ncbi:MAG: hypothetical protein ACPGVD_02645 [Flavobacteriales bacterium]
MKTIALSILITLLGFGSLAQGGNYGETNPKECKKNQSLYRDNLSKEQFAQAYPFWVKAVNFCPDFGADMYEHGVWIMTELRANASKERKNALRDSIIWAYEENIKRFGATNELNESYGEDLIKLGKTTAGVEKLSKVLDSTKKLGSTSIYYYSIGLKRLKSKDKKDCDVIVEEYDKLSEIIEKNAEVEGFDYAQTAIDKNLGPCLTCDKLIPIIRKKKFEKAKTDGDLRKVVLANLKRRGCVENDVYETLLEVECNENPGKLCFIGLAKKYAKKGNNAKAEEYYRKALELAETNEEKIEILGDAAAEIPSKRGKFMNEILAINPSNGDAILYKADKIARSRCGTSEFDDKAIYWAAYDKAAKAKSADPSVAAKASKLMAAYKSRFPDSTQLFEQGLKVGQKYTTCNGHKTTVKNP